MAALKAEQRNEVIDGGAPTTEAPGVVRSREHLLHLLAEAAELVTCPQLPYQCFGRSPGLKVK